MLMTATPAWLGQSRQERATFTVTVIQPVLERYADRVHVRFYDAEAFAARCYSSPASYFFSMIYLLMVEHLRDDYSL